jgi:hypothetical protein
LVRFKNVQQVLNLVLPNVVCVYKQLFLVLLRRQHGYYKCSSSQVLGKTNLPLLTDFASQYLSLLQLSDYQAKAIQSGRLKGKSYEILAHFAESANLLHPATLPHCT